MFVIDKKVPSDCHTVRRSYSSISQFTRVTEIPKLIFIQSYYTSVKILGIFFMENHM